MRAWTDGNEHVVRWRDAVCVYSADRRELTHWYGDGASLDARWRSHVQAPADPLQGVDARSILGLTSAAAVQMSTGWGYGHLVAFAEPGKPLAVAWLNLASQRVMHRTDLEVVPSGPFLLAGAGLVVTEARGTVFYRVAMDTQVTELAVLDDAVAFAVGPKGDPWLVHHGEYAAVYSLRTDSIKAEGWLVPPNEAEYEGWIDAPSGLVCETLHWSGRAGRFHATGVLRNAGKDRVGVRLEVPTGGPVRIDGGRLDDVELHTEEGALFFAHAPLAHDRPLRLELWGRAHNDGKARLRACWERARDTMELGQVVVQVAIEGGLRARRGDDELILDRSWITGLTQELDQKIREPDLGRWVRRALARCRVNAVADDPEGVLAEWLRMTERDRAATSSEGIPAYKLATGKHWMVTADEARVIRRSLGTEHPFGAFAAGGAFEVVGDDPFSG